MRMPFALMLIGIAATASVGSAAAQPVIVDRLNASDVDRLFPNLSLADIPMTSSTTRTEVIARWGSGIPTMSSAYRYHLNSGDSIELRFSPVAPYGLVHARLFDGTPGGRLLYDNNPRIRSRRYADIRRCPQSPGYVASIWGPPDYEFGSGITTGFYDMPDRGSVRVSDASPRCKAWLRR